MPGSASFSSTETTAATAPAASPASARVERARSAISCGGTAALAADPERQNRRVEDQRVGFGCIVGR